jgi:hypothetical protein
VNNVSILVLNDRNKLGRRYEAQICLRHPFDFGRDGSAGECEFTRDRILCLTRAVVCRPLRGKKIPRREKDWSRERRLPLLFVVPQALVLLSIFPL